MCSARFAHTMLYSFDVDMATERLKALLFCSSLFSSFVSLRFVHHFLFLLILVLFFFVLLIRVSLEFQYSDMTWNQYFFSTLPGLCSTLSIKLIRFKLLFKYSSPKRDRCVTTNPRRRKKCFVQTSMYPIWNFFIQRILLLFKIEIQSGRSVWWRSLSFDTIIRFHNFPDILIFPVEKDAVIK